MPVQNLEHVPLRESNMLKALDHKYNNKKNFYNNSKKYVLYIRF